MPVDESGRWIPVQQQAKVNSSKPPKWFNPYDDENKVVQEELPAPTPEPAAPEPEGNWYTRLDKNKFSGSLPFGAPSPYDGEADFQSWGEVADTALKVSPQLQGVGMAFEGVKSLPYVGKAINTVVGAPSKVKEVVKAIPTPYKVTAGAASVVPAIETYRGATDSSVKDNNFFTETGASLRAGTGDLVETAGNIANWQGYNELGDSLTSTGQGISEGFEVDPGGEFGWHSLLDHKTYSVRLARTLPSTAALIPLMVAGYKGANAAAGMITSKLGAPALTPTQKVILGSLAGSDISRPVEAAMEAGEVFKQSQLRGDSFEVSNKAAEETYRKNLALAGLDAVQIAAMFTPTLRTGSRLGKAAMTAGKVGVAGITEGGEEVYQDYIQRTAQGQEFAWDSQSKEAGFLGAILGAGMGGFGAVHEAIAQRVVEQLPPEGQQAFNSTIDAKMDAGMTEEQAISSTFDDLVGNDIGKSIIEQAVQGVMADIQSGAFTPTETQTDTTTGRKRYGTMKVKQPEIMPTESIMPVNEALDRDLPEDLPEYAQEESQVTTDIITRNMKDAKVGDTIYDTKGNKFTVTDISDPSLLKIKNDLGTEGSIGRKKASFTPPEQTTKTPEIVKNKHNEVISDLSTNIKPDTTFKTEKGSTYNVFGDTTQRYKVKHDYHDPKDVGWKKQSSKTVYVDPEFAVEIGMRNTSSAKGKRIVIDKERIILLSKNPKTGKLGIDKTDSNNSFTTTPEIGKSPLELWEPDERGFYRGNHPGNAIVEISETKAPEVEQETPADTNTTEVSADTGNTPVPEKQDSKPKSDSKAPKTWADIASKEGFGPIIKDPATMSDDELETVINSSPEQFGDMFQSIKHAEKWQKYVEKEIARREKEAKKQSQETDKDVKMVEEEPVRQEEVKSEEKPKKELPFGIVPSADEQRYYGSEVLVAGTKYEEEYKSTVTAVLNKGTLIQVVDPRSTPEDRFTTRVDAERVTVIKLMDSRKEESSNEQPTEDTNVNSSPSRKLAEFVMERIESQRKLSSVELFLNADKAFGGNQASKAYTVKDAYDAMELGFNLYLLKHKKSVGPYIDAKSAKGYVETLQYLMDRLPTQTKRTTEQDEFQQFSTPPSLAYIAAWTANMTRNDTVLEPSAGIGGLAVFAKTAGAQVVVNELSPRRAEVLREMNFDRVFTENAEQINNILPADIKPTVVIMNPPFSSTSGRVKGKTDNKNVIPHIEQALKRLQPNGRLVAIVGRGMSEDAATFKQWWRDTKKTYNVRANIGIDGKNYTKYGTSFDVQILVIDKNGPTTRQTAVGKVDKLEDILPLLEGIKRDRPEINVQNEQKPDKPKSEIPATAGEAETGPNNPVPPATGNVGTDNGGSKGGLGTEQERSGGTEGSTRSDVRDESGKDNGPTNQAGTGRVDTVDNAAGNDTTKNSSGNSTVPTGKNGERTGNVKVESKKDKKTTETELTDAVFSQYTPQKLKIKGAKEHPGKLAQSSAMAAVEPPTPTYTPNLPQEVIDEGKLSLPQLEAVVYAGQAHEQVLPDGNRRGFFIGDGTGVGKGREISGIILDNMRQGRTKAVWISKNYDLFKDAIRDYSGVGGDSSKLFSLNKVKSGTAIKQKDGIVFTTYDTLGRGANLNPQKRTSDKIPDNSRFMQLVNWLGKDYDGVIAFDEAHQMQNSMPRKGKMGKKEGADRALAGIELQKLLPNARIVYVSATGATEVSNLAYADRLGLWGKGTAFADKNDFVTKISASGITAMEVVARDSKAVGAYLSRSLDYEDVTYGTLRHDLTEEQTEIYDTMALGWQTVLQNLNKALEETGQSKDGNAKRNAKSRFWNTQQRFFNQILTSMQMPSVIKAVREDLANGNAVVMQLVNTNQAALNRQLSKMESEDELDDLDLTPREALMGYIQKSFPVQQYEEYTDEDGNLKSRPVFDSEGNPVENQEAVAMREELLDKIGSMKVPSGPLEIIFNEFGSNNIAEVTGRDRRVVKTTDEYGNPKSIIEKLSESTIEADVDAFLDDRKQILIFSDKGGTGKSYHASLDVKNQRRRIHYLIQAGWKADAAVQGFGRSHRTNQANAPHYVLVTTNLDGQKRFISSIARRLDQLGALTKGQRQTGSQGMFTASDNLESEIAMDSLQHFYRSLADDKIDGLEPKEIFSKLGLESMLDDHGNLKEDPELRNITKFLNRILSLESSLQNKVFQTFSGILETAVEIADKNGTLDKGLENLKADKVEVTDEKIVYTDKSGAETKYIGLNLGSKIKPRPFGKVSNLHNLLGIYKNTKSGRVYAVVNTGTLTTLTSGGVDSNYRVYGQAMDNITTTTKREFERGNWEKLSEEEAENAWNEQLDKLPEYRYRSEHLITGALLPIWDRLPEGRVRVIRVLTDDGRILLGRLIPEKGIDYTLKKLGASRDKGELNTENVVSKILQGYTVNLANGWKISRRKVAGDYRIEIIGKDMYRHMTNLAKEGVFTERIQYETRFFIPTGDKAVEVFDKVTEYRPIIDVVAPAETSSTKRTMAEVDAELAAMVDEKIGDVRPSVGMSVRDVSRNRRNRDDRQPPRPTIKIENKEANKRFDASQGMPQESGKLKEYLTTLWHQISRAFEHLPAGQRFEPVRFQLLELKKQVGVANDKTLRILQGLTSKMDKPAYTLFRHKVIFDDLINEAEVQEVTEEQVLWFGMTIGEMKDHMVKINEEMEFYPEVGEAVQLRHDLWAGFKDDYIKAMKDIGYNVEKKLQKEDYYRHMVIKYAEEKYKANMGKKKVTMPTKASYLRQRGNTSLDINTEFIEAEYEIMARMLYDIERAKFFKMLDDKYNLVKELKRQAIEVNDANIMPLFREMAEQWNDNANIKRDDYTGEDVYRQTLNKKQAMAITKLAGMAVNGVLPDNNGMYRGLISDLIESYYDEDGMKRDEILPLSNQSSNQLYRYAAWILKTSDKADIEGRSITDLKDVPSDIVGYQVRLPGKEGFGKVVAYHAQKGMAKVNITDKETKTVSTREYRITDLKLIGKGNNAGTPAMAAAMLFKGRAEKQKFLKENLGEKYVTWEKLIPEGYSQLKQKEGTIFYFADSIESKQAEMLYSGMVEELGIKQEDLQRVMVMGGQIKDYVIPDEIILTIDNLDPYKASKNILGQSLRATQRAWKVYQLISPRRFFKYNIRNLSGDADALFVGNPGAFKKVPQAVKELYPVFRKDRSMTPNMKDWFERGGFETLLQAQEIGEINQLKMFVDIIERENKNGLIKKAGTQLLKGWHGYWKTVRLSTDMREAILRYAAYLDFLEQMEKNAEGRPKTFAASYEDEVMALDDIKDRAFKLSNELLGAYDQVSVIGQGLREYLIPFWSWQEVNIKRYVKLMKNAARDDQLAGLVGRKLLVGVAVRSPALALRVGRLALMATALWVLLTLWNNTFFPDEEKELSEDERRKPHVIFGRNKDGSISNFTRLGALQDFVDWFGVDAGSIQDIRDILNGKMSIKEWAQNTGKNFLNKLGQGITPFIKAPVEAAAGKKFFPDVFEPQTVRDGWKNFFQSLSLDNEYALIKGLPSRPYNETFENLFYYNTDPKQVTYYATLDKRDEFKKKVLKKGSGSGESIRGDALYNYKLAVRYKDKEAALKYLKEYAINGGTLNGMIRSYKMSHPLYGMTREQQVAFIKSLDKEDFVNLKKAMVYYQDNYGKKLMQLESMK